jgi:metal transporter CNNM
VKNLLPLRRWKRYLNTLIRKWSKDQSYALQVRREPLHTLSEDEEAVGIITMENAIQ